MVRQKVRTPFLLFKKSHGKEKGKNWILTFQKKKSNGNEKGKSPILTFEKNHIVIKR